MSRNRDLLESFTAYCQDNPEQRFWQALRNWSGFPFILVTGNADWRHACHVTLKDTFYWEARDGQRRSVDAEASR